jgi:signal transduction histidine kinase
MHRRPDAILGESLARGKGFAYLSARHLRYTLRRAALTAVAIVAFVTALSATSAVLEGHANAGLVFDAESGMVTAVSPTGFAWRDGVRPGQRVVSAGLADDPRGWHIETIGPGGPIESREGPIEDALRSSLPFAILAVAACVVAVFLVRTGREWVLPMASVSLLASSVPLFLANSSNAGATLLFAAAVPTFGIAWRLRRRVALTIAVASVAAIGLVLWYVNWVSGTPDGESYEKVRRIIAVGATGLLIADRAVQGARSARPRMSRVGLARDVVAVVAVGSMFIVLYLSSFPAPVIAVAMILGLLAALPLRAYLARRLEYALTADLRAQVTADVAEEERARLARELHDIPLQALSGVIRSLELLPSARKETGRLVEIADQLRAVAIELHPPMLDDVGLGAALDFLAEANSSERLLVEAAIHDTTAPYHRPPGTVELAVYRIAHEAVMNAIAHAKATRIVIAAAVGEDAIDLQIVDDGVGLTDQELRQASTRGRLGVASMRRRAKGIDADLGIKGSKVGTEVSVTWRA